MRLTAVICLASNLILACGKNQDGGAADPTGGGGSGDAVAQAQMEKQILSDAAAQVIIPTYRALAMRAEALTSAVQAFAHSRDAATLEALRNAWIATRSPWEQSEAFLFGPVETYGYDAAIDSWPLNRTDLTAVLNSGKGFDAELIATLPNNQKGFHMIEFLIFGETSRKAASEFNSRELEYMSAGASNLRTIANQLADSWESGSDGKPAFKEVFASAGDGVHTTYPSRTAALQELVAHMANICHEVGESKIATPFDAQDPNLVESQFSFNSLKDFADNIRSVENIYTASYPSAKTSGTALSLLVAKRRPALPTDTQVKAAIAEAITAIQAIPEPFPVALKDQANAPVIKAAQQALADLEKRLTQSVGGVLQP